MSDTALNKFVGYGTAAQRGAFTPAPATLAAAPFQLYLWYETDTGLIWGYDTTWHNLSNANGAFALASAISPAALGADQNDYSPTGLSTANAIRLSASIATVNITGLAGGSAGRFILIFNVGASNNLVLKNESASSTAANRFDATADVTLAPSAWTLLWYDSTSSRWRVLVSSSGGGTGTVTHTGALTANALILGNGSADITAMASLGTTTTVLHGNAAGAPTFGAVSLTADVTGTLPVASGGTGAGTLTAHGVLIGEGTSAVVATAAGAQGQALIAQASGSDPAFQGIGWILLSEVTTSGTQASVTFSSIPAVFRDLRIVIRGRGTNAATNADTVIQFNGDTATNYDWQYGSASNTSVTAGAGTSQTFIFTGTIAGATAPAGYAGLAEATIADYRGTTFNKVVLADSHAAKGTAGTDQQRAMLGGTWHSTAAINAVKVLFNGGSFVDGSVVSLYASL